MKGPIATLTGRLIAARRVNCGLGQSDLAAQLGVSRQAIWFLEHGQQTPSWTTLYAMAEVLKCEPSDLMPTRRQVNRVRNGSGK